MFRNLKRREGRKSNALVVKLDMSKAYDRLEWVYLEIILHAFGFDDHLVRLVMACISSVSYRLNFNGEDGNPITPTRGLRQGDPLSPYLFILSALGLSSLLKDALDKGHISGLTLSTNCPTISHLLHGDDAMIFTEATDSEAFVLQNVLNIYSRVSGQRINVAKSELLFSINVNDRRKHSISTILHMPICSIPCRYLDLLGSWKGSKCQALTWLKEKIWQKLHGWEETLLSHAGKEVLITILFFFLPKTFYHTITSMIAKFWWKNGGRYRGIHWRKWFLLKNPKKDDGLGFREMHAMNIALIAKQAWRIEKQSEALWVRILKGLYLSQSSGWEAKRGRNALWGWNSIIQGIYFLQKHVGWHIKDGSRVKIFGDKRMYNGSRIWTADTHLRDMIVQNLMVDGRMDWDDRKIQHHISRDLLRVVRLLLLTVCRLYESN